MSLLMFGVVSLLFALSSCGENPGVHYILPNDYVGLFAIVLDERDGNEVKLEDGRYTYEIPASGVLKVKSFAPFRPLHEETAAYQNGKSILLLGSTLPDDAVGLRSLGSYQRGDGPPTIAFVIGTKKDEDELRRQMLSPDFDKKLLRRGENK